LLGPVPGAATADDLSLFGLPLFGNVR
jgi:hypothetical protein